MKIGDLVRIKQSYSQKKIGKLAIVVEKRFLDATIFIIDSGKKQKHDISKLEVIDENR